MISIKLTSLVPCCCTYICTPWGYVLGKVLYAVAVPGRSQLSTYAKASKAIHKLPRPVGCKCKNATRHPSAPSRRIYPQRPEAVMADTLPRAHPPCSPKSVSPYYLLFACNHHRHPAVLQTTRHTNNLPPSASWPFPPPTVAVSCTRLFAFHDWDACPLPKAVSRADLPLQAKQS